MGLVTTVIITALVGCVVRTIWDFAINHWGDRTKKPVPDTVRVEMSDTDKEKIRESQELVREKFGDNAAEALRNASKLERVNMIASFANDLAALYGLDIDIDITCDDIRSCGYYDWQEKKAVFNVALLMVDGNHEKYELCVREVFDTIFHELRHAVQRQAIEEPGFWNVSQEQADTWKNNMNNYIRSNVDYRGYASQPIEADASTFASEVMSGVN